MLINLRNALVAGKKSPLPPGVLPLGFVCGTKEDYGITYQQKIVTNIKPSIDFELEGEFESFSPADQPWLYYFGVQSGDDSNDQFSFRNWDWQTTSAQVNIGNRSVKVTIPSGRFYLKMNKTEVYINNDRYALAPPTVQVYNDFLYFCSSNWGGIACRPSKNIIYWAKLYNSGNLVADFIPVSANSVATLYDKVGKYICPSSTMIVGGGGYKRQCVRRSHRRSLRPSRRFWRTPLWKEVA